jgi:Derlin-2/3
MAFMTTSTIDSLDVPMTLFGFITIPSQYLPYLFVMCGPVSALLQGTGLVAAHVYNFLTGLYPHCGGPSQSFITTPEWMRKFFGTRGEVARPYSTLLNANAASGSTSSGVGASA